MRIGIVGAGFTGLSAAYYLLSKGHDVTIFEKDENPGGLAVGFKNDNWDWTLEKHYHHWFTNDKFILNLAKEINHKVIIKRPKTSVLVDNKIYQFDSPKEVLLFPKLPLLDRLRMGFVIGFLKFNPFWKPLEKINASMFLPKTIGKKSYEMIWEPLFKNKFGPYANNVSLAWFWARIVKRTPSLAYPQGGYLNFTNHLTEVVKQKGGKVYFNNEVVEIISNNKCDIYVKSVGEKKTKYSYDKLIFTLSTSLFVKSAPQISKNYKKRYSNLKSLGATNLVLRLKKPFLVDGTYWLNVCDKNSPIMAIVEHTNFMNKNHYNNEYIVYLGNYVLSNSKRYRMDGDELLKIFDPYLKKINKEYKKNLIGFELFKAPFAQPIIPTNYSKNIPPFKTPLKNVYLANMQQVYPWDRGTNYAVELGIKISNYILKNDN